MDPLTKKLQASPALIRSVPFVIVLVLTSCQGLAGEASRYWFYVAKIFAGAWFIWTIRPFVREMRWAFSWEAVVVGIAVFVMWVGLDGFYPSIDQITQKYICPIFRLVGLESWCKPSHAGLPWNPRTQFGASSAVAWFVIVVRILGSSLVVPPLEEVFYRSFLYRWIVRSDFEAIPVGYFAWKPFLATAAIFGFCHHEWLAGILCGFAYQGLVCWKNRLGDAMTAHAITNFILGVWIVWKGAWNFW